MQLSAVEKTEIRKILKRGSSQTEMDRVVSEWRRLTHSLIAAAAHSPSPPPRSNFTSLRAENVQDEIFAAAAAAAAAAARRNFTSPRADYVQDEILSGVPT